MGLVIKLRAKRLHGDIVEDTIFVGEKGHTLQNVGNLTFHLGEWQLFGAALMMGAKQTGGDLEVIPDGWTPGGEEEE